MGARGASPGLHLVDPDFLARERRHLWAGAHGSAKTTMWAAMLAASLSGTQFLGRDVPSLQWLVVSGEQTARELTDTFDALKIAPRGLADQVHWTPREAGVKLGEPVWDAWLAREVENHQPDVMVLDTVGMVVSDVAVRVGTTASVGPSATA